MSKKIDLRLAMFLLFVWGSVLASGTYWAMRFQAPKPIVLQAPVPVIEPNRFDYGSILGHEPAPTTQVSTPPSVLPRIKVTGIVISNPSFAIISVDSTVARPARVGRKILEDLSIKSISENFIELQDSKGIISKLELETPQDGAHEFISVSTLDTTKKAP